MKVFASKICLPFRETLKLDSEPFWYCWDSPFWVKRDLPLLTKNSYNKPITMASPLLQESNTLKQEARSHAAEALAMLKVTRPMEHAVLQIVQRAANKGVSVHAR